MMKTNRLTLRLLFFLLIIGLPLGIWYHALGDNKNSRRDYELLFPKNRQESLLWPNQRSWVFSADLPKDVDNDCLVSLIARSVHKDMKENESPAIFERIISKQEAESSLSPGMLGIGESPHHPIYVSVQLIDLKEIGIQSQDEEKPIRLLMNLLNGGTCGQLPYPRTCIEGDFISGWTGINGKWENGELHLLNLYVIKGNRLTIYDILLSLNERPCSHPD